MAEYIEKDNLIRWIERQKRLSKLGTILGIQDTPAVDVAAVVRCKDCVKRETVLCPLETYDDFPWRASREDDFCSYGERRANV